MESTHVNRRDFLRGIVAAGAVSGAGLGAAYFGYGKVNDPVRVAVIGTGDEGNVLIGGCNPDYVDVVAIAIFSQCLASGKLVLFVVRKLVGECRETWRSVGGGDAGQGKRGC